MKLKRIVSASAALMLALASVPTTAFAAGSEKQKTVRVIVENNTFSKAEGAKWDGVLLDSTVAINNESTAFTAFSEAVKNAGFSLSASGDWIMDIAGVGTETKAEEAYAGWTFSYNDWFAANTLGAFTVSDGTLSDGDIIAVQYTETWSDLGGDFANNDTSLKSLTISDGTLDKESSATVTDYTVTLSGVTDIIISATAANKNFQIRSYKNEYAPESAAHYRVQDAISVVDGDKIIVGVGDPAWESMNSGQTVSKYTINVVSDIKSDSAEKVSAVEKLIDSIGEVTLDSAEAISNARTEYLRLNDGEKKLVENLKVLEDAEKKLAELRKENGPSKDFMDMFNDTADNVAKSDAAVGSEWKMIGLARAGKLTDSSKNKFLESLGKYVTDSEENKLNSRRSSENSKESLAAAALGKDPKKYAGKDILTPVKDKDYASIQGISGQIWANIALTSVGDESAYTDELTKAQLESGSFSYDGRSEDVDITAMVITALAKNASSKDVINKAVEWLSSKQHSDGSFGNCESTAQVIVALSSIGIDCDSDPRFIKNGQSLMDGLAAFYLGKGSFAHEGNSADNMATEQAFLALTSYYRFYNSMTAIYDLSDVALSEYELPSENKSNANNNNNTDNNSKTGAAAPLTFVVMALSAAAMCLAGKNKDR